ncbi:hypothetical protein ACFWSF_34380 [Streptomyces sp. NPDC058611]|uniref:hypothetical protein n=1 Tax=unclassified Streptomyces TaxID=2593676 RepID=UPI00365BE988
MTPHTNTTRPDPAAAPNRFAMYEAVLIRRQLTDAEWHELQDPAGGVCCHCPGW